ncbi:MAG: hypothetical protein AAF750_18515 [Planctomycetota bacterium]
MTDLPTVLRTSLVSLALLVLLPYLPGCAARSATVNAPPSDRIITLDAELFAFKNAVAVGEPLQVVVLITNPYAVPVVLPRLMIDAYSYPTRRTPANIRHPYVQRNAAANARLLEHREPAGEIWTEVFDNSATGFTRIPPGHQHLLFITVYTGRGPSHASQAEHPATVPAYETPTHHEFATVQLLNDDAFFAGPPRTFALQVQYDSRGFSPRLALTNPASDLRTQDPKTKRIHPDVRFLTNRLNITLSPRVVTDATD